MIVLRIAEIAWPPALVMAWSCGHVAHPDRHDHLVIAIDRCLAVVTLDPAITALEDVAVGVGAGPLGGSLGIAGCIGDEGALRHRQSVCRARGDKAQPRSFCLLDRQLLGVIGALAGMRSWLMALCLLALVRSLMPSNATGPRLTNPAFWQTLRSWTHNPVRASRWRRRKSLIRRWSGC